MPDTELNYVDPTVGDDTSKHNISKLNENYANDETNTDEKTDEKEFGGFKDGTLIREGYDGGAVFESDYGVRVAKDAIDDEKNDTLIGKNDGGAVFGSSFDVRVAEDAIDDEKNETLIGKNDGGAVFESSFDVGVAKGAVFESSFDVGVAKDAIDDEKNKTLIEKNDGGAIFESNLVVGVTENTICVEKNEGKEAGDTVDETLAKNCDDLSGNFQIIEGEQYNVSLDETVIQTNDDFSGKFEKIEGNGGVVFESNADVMVTDIDTENEKIEGQKLRDTMDETGIEKDGDLSGNGVGLEANSSVRVSEDESEEDEVSFFESDLVWGKVRSHPWWPGQIFNPSDASGKAKKYSKKDGLLIAYFGDQTFAFNEAAKIKPFKEHFVDMEKQSKAEAFCYAVDCALGEVSRRVEYGLACKCLSNEVYDTIKTQKVVNAGIRKESSEREGGDVNGDFSGESFVPLDLLSYMEGLAKNPCGGTDRLDFVTAQAQLLAFNRHKGFNELPEVNMFGELLSAEKDGDVSLGKHKGIKEGSKKRKNVASDSVALRKGERNKSGRDTTSPSFKKGKVDTNVTDNMMVEEKTDLSLETAQKTFSNIGKRICSVIPALKDGGDCSILSSGKKRGRKKVIKAENLSPDEILTHLCAIARDPIKGYSSLGSIISFFSDMRIQLSLEKSEVEKSTEGGEGLSNEIMGDFVVEGFEDSYWTDRLVVSDVQEQVLFEPEAPDEDSETQIGNGIASVESDPKRETGDDVDMEIINDVNMEAGDYVNAEIGDNNNLGSDNSVSDEKSNPTALILNFSDINSVPSQNELNNIFRRYGPLNETGTEIIKKSKRAKVIFKRRLDAETAFSSSGKFSIFGPSLVSYRLHYLPMKQDSVSPAKKRSKKGAKSMEDNDG